MKQVFPYLKIASLLAFLCCFTSVSAQIEAPCAFDEVLERELAADPNFAARVAAYNKGYQKYIANKTPRRAGEKAPLVTIPLVFHIIHRGEAVGTGSNITDEQVISAVDGMNIQYRNLNPDGTTYDPDGTDLEFEFCLAQRDPDGNPTNGINRVDGSGVTDYSNVGITSPGNEQQVKALSRWDNKKYYNVWVVAQIDGQEPFGAGTKGYAYFPGAGANVDGTVVLFNYTGYDPDGSRGLQGNGQLANGSLDNGTMVHEIGHAFSLYHTFQGASSNGGNCPPAESNCSSDGDLVCDTDPHDSHLGTCKAGTANNMCTGQPYGINVTRNYMNYTNCSNLIFTPGQRDRVRYALENQRSYFNVTGTPEACVPVFEHDIALRKIYAPTGFYCDGNVAGEILVKNNGQNTITSFEIEIGIDGSIVDTYTYNGNLSSQDEVTITLPAVSAATGAHTYSVQVKANSINGSNADEFASNDYLENDFEVIEGSTVNVTVSNFDGADRFEFIDDNGTVVANFSFSGLSGTFDQDFCLPNDACYTFKYYDAVFVHPQFGGTPPSYSIKEPSNGFIIESGYDSNPLFSGGPYEDETNEFCMPYDPGFLTADFSVSAKVVPINTPVSFFDATQSGDGDQATSWKWDFGDGNTDNIKSPTHSYANPGVYTVELIADNDIRPDTATKIHIIRVVDEITGCDQFNNLLSGESSTYYQTVDGETQNFPGINQYAITQYAERFFAPSASKVNYVELNIAAINATDPENELVVKIFSGNFTSGPSNLLYSQNVKIGDLIVGLNRINFDNFPEVNQFYFVGYEPVNSNDEIIVATAPYRGENDLSNTAFGFDGSWKPIEDIITEATATALDITASLSYIPIANAFSEVTDICAQQSFNLVGEFSENTNSYLWKFPAGADRTVSSNANQTITYFEGGTYDIWFYATGGCNIVDSALVQMTVDSIPSVDIELTHDLCNQGNGTATAITRGGSGSTNFTWSFDANFQGSKHTGATAGNYTYVWSDPNCGVNNKTETYTINNESQVAEFDLNVTQTSCGFNNGRLSAVTDGLLPYTFEWTKTNDPFTSQSSGINSLSPGEYTVEVKFTGCSSRSKTVNIVSSDSLKGTVSPISQVCPGIADTLYASGGDSLKWFDYSGNLFANNAPFIIVDSNKTTRFNVVIYGDTGCTLNLQTGVNLLPKAKANAKVTTGQKEYSDTTYIELANGEVALFSSSGTFGASIMWDFGDGTTSTVKNPPHAYDTAGVYEVILYAFNDGCDDNDTAWVFVSDSRPTSIRTLGNNEVKLYPNPAKETLTINSGTYFGNNATVKIVDITGKTILETPLQEQVQSVNISNIKSGMYFLKIADNKNKFVGKFTRME